MATGGEGRVEFVAKRCKVEIESVPLVGVVSQKLPISRWVVLKVAHLGT